MNSKDKELVEKAEDFIKFARDNIGEFNPMGDNIILELQKAVMIKRIIEVDDWSAVLGLRKFINIGIRAVGKGKSYGFKLNKLKRLLELEDNIR